MPSPITLLLPIEFTSEESKRPHRREERYLYLRYLLLAIAGCSIVLYLSLGDNTYLYSIGTSIVLLAPVEYLRSRIKEEEEAANIGEGLGRRQQIAQYKPPPPSSSSSSRSSASETSNAQIAEPARSKPSTDTILIALPACLACAIISVVSYQQFQRQLNLGLGNTLGVSIDFLFMILFGVACIGLLAYNALLLKGKYFNKDRR